MSKEIDINNEEQILKECDFDYYYNSVCSRELCMFFNDIARQDSHFDKRQAYIDLGRIGIMINKLFRENTDLEAKLADKKQQLSDRETKWAIWNKKDRVEFAIAELEKVKNVIGKNFDGIGFNTYCERVRPIERYINNQIEELNASNSMPLEDKGE